VTEPEPYFQHLLRGTVPGAATERYADMLDSTALRGIHSRRLDAEHRLGGRSVRSRAAHVDAHTRAIVRAVVQGRLHDVATHVDPVFGCRFLTRFRTCRRKSSTRVRLGRRGTLTTVRRKSCARCSRRTFTRSARPARPPADLRIAYRREQALQAHSSHRITSTRCRRGRRSSPERERGRRGRDEGSPGEGDRRSR